MQAACKNTKSIKLSFSRCKFPEDTLQRNWLSTNLSIEELTFDSCFLSDIEDDVFSLAIYQSTQKLFLISNKLYSLRRAMFSHLDSLTELSIRENIIQQAEYNLLEYVASSLTSLELSTAIEDPEVLKNVTGGNKSLKVQILSLRRNSIPLITSELFEGVPAVQSLYLEDSRVKRVSRGFLDSMDSILLLMINKNHIQSLPEGLLDSILHSQRLFRMSIHNNSWRCDCGLKWLQDLVKARPDIIFEKPVCSTPEINAGKLFTDADFCPSNSTSTTSTEETTKHDSNQTTTLPSTTTQGHAGLTCDAARTFLQNRVSRRLLSNDFVLPSRFPGFSASKVQDEGVLVNLPDLDEGLTLLWFDNDDVNPTLSCAKTVEHSYLIPNIDRQATYTICLLSDNRNTVSPLNCLAVTTDPDYQYRTWLRNADKTVVFSLIIAAFVSLFLVGAFFTFMLIRRHPSLLRGSKRVMLVKRRNLDAIVLPKGVSIEEQGQGSGHVELLSRRMQEDGYITPLPPAPAPAPRTRRISRMSLQSDWHSYVSELEPETPLASWKLNRLNNETEKRSEAPPLPPGRPDRVPSLSLAVESKTEYWGDQASNFENFCIAP